jgi:hypothetical protein
MFEMGEVGNRLRAQDNRFTAEPIFLVQEEKRIYGIDIAYDPKIDWCFNDEMVSVSKQKARSLEKHYQETGIEKEGFRRLGYAEEWVYVQPFFTEAAADLYIKQNSHRHSGKLRTYADSAYRNHEWIAVRKHLSELAEAGGAL